MFHGMFYVGVDERGTVKTNVQKEKRETARKSKSKSEPLL